MGALDGRVAIITGAGRGIGREHALLFAHEGAKVVVNDLGGGLDGSSQTASPAEEVVAEIKAMGGEAVANHDNVADWEGGQRLVQCALDTFGTLHVLEAARACRTPRLVHTSTSETYGTARTVPISETHPLQAQSPYAASKTAADKLVESFHLSFGVPAVTLRPFNTFGPRQSTRAVIPQIITQLASGSQQLMLGALDPTRDFSYVLDTAQAFIEVGNAPASAVLGELFNCGPGDDIAIGKLAEDICRLMGVEADILEDPKRLRPKDSEVMRLVCDATKLRERTGWAPRYTRDEGLRETIEWFREPANLAYFKTGEYHQ